MSRIGLFGGTFDPVHYGHIKIARSFLDSGLIDQLWIMVTPESPHKQGQDLTSYDLRFKMTYAAFSDIDDCQVRDDENELPAPSYTSQTLNYLRKQYPAHSFHLCIGEDSLASFDRWHHYREILDETPLLVARRPDNRADIDLPGHATIHFVPHEPVDISSSGIRDHLRSGGSVEHLVPANVVALIAENDLYT